MQDHHGRDAHPTDPIEVLVYFVLGLALLLAALPDLLSWVTR